MKKTLLTICFSMIAVCTVVAQRPITLTGSGINFQAGTSHYSSVNPSGIKIPKADTNQTWNYSNIGSNGISNIIRISNPNKLFSKSITALADTGKSEALTSNSTLKSSLIFDYDSFGVFQAGYYIAAQKYSLANYFGQSTDKIEVHEQNVHFRSNEISFPTSFKSGHRLNAIRQVNFNITVATEGLGNAPGTKSTYMDKKDTCVGWGTLRIPSANKASKAYQVLLVKTKRVLIDSYFIAQKPVDIIFLKALGINQGAKTINYKESFYRQGYADPMMILDFGSDSTYTKLSAVYYTKDSINSAVRIDEPTIENFSIYPNPIKSGTDIHCRINKTSLSPWRLMVMNSLGQVVYVQDIIGIGDTDVLIPTYCLKYVGIFYLNMVNEYGLSILDKKFIVVK